MSLLLAAVVVPAWSIVPPPRPVARPPSAKRVYTYRTIGGVAAAVLPDTFYAAGFAGRLQPRRAHVFSKKQPEAELDPDPEHADLFDLLLDSDEPTRYQLMAQELRSGALTRAEVDDLLSRVARLERVMGCVKAAPMSDREPVTSWGIDYPI